MKKTGYIFIILIIILGVALRTICIDKSEGLWNDEYVGYLISTKPLLKGFVENVFAQCHMPLYYLYLKLTMKIFGDSDIILRASSEFAGLLSIIAMYYVGKTKNEKTGLLTALFTAISSFLIYYSQEVRLYSLLFLFSALSLLATINLIKKQNKLNAIFYIITNLLIIFTHTIGFVYVFFNIAGISLLFYKKYRKQILVLNGTILAGLLLAAPLIIHILTTKTFSQWWGHFTISKLGFILTDYFSPVLTNLINAPDNFFYDQKIFLAIIPTLIAVFWIIKGTKQLKEKGIFYITISILTLIILTIAAASGKLVLTTKYTIEIYPILIYLASIGALSITNKKLSILLFSIYFILNLGYIIISPVSAPKMKRPEGNKLVADMLQRAGIRDNDIILFTYYSPDRFGKYLDTEKYRLVTINKGNFNEYLAPNVSYIDAYKQGKALFRNTFINYNNEHFENRVYKEVIANLEENQSVYLITLDSVSSLTPENMYEIVKDDKHYFQTPLFYLIFSYIKSETYYILSKHLYTEHFEVKGNWRIIKLTKLKNS